MTEGLSVYDYIDDDGYVELQSSRNRFNVIHNNNNKKNKHKNKISKKKKKKKNNNNNNNNKEVFKYKRLVYSEYCPYVQRSKT